MIFAESSGQDDDMPEIEFPQKVYDILITANDVPDTINPEDDDL